MNFNVIRHLLAQTVISRVDKHTFHKAQKIENTKPSRIKQLQYIFFSFNTVEIFYQIQYLNNFTYQQLRLLTSKILLNGID